MTSAYWQVIALWSKWSIRSFQKRRAQNRQNWSPPPVRKMSALDKPSTWVRTRLLWTLDSPLSKL